MLNKSFVSVYIAIHKKDFCVWRIFFLLCVNKSRWILEFIPPTRLPSKKKKLAIKFYFPFSPKYILSFWKFLLSKGHKMVRYRMYVTIIDHVQVYRVSYYSHWSLHCLWSQLSVSVFTKHKIQHGMHSFWGLHLWILNMPGHWLWEQLEWRAATLRTLSFLFKICYTMYLFHK